MTAFNTFSEITMRRTDQDRRPPRRALTAILMGDPAPDRLARAQARRNSLERRATWPCPARSGGGRE